MPVIYVYDLSGGEEEPAVRETERAAQRAKVRARYAHRVTDLAGVDEITAELVMAALFDHVDVVTGALCVGNHPALPEPGGYGDVGFDCRHQWSQDRRQAATPRSVHEHG